MLELAIDPLVSLAGVFPPNGLDRSLHAPVLIGLFILTVFRETLGWSYSGLVVPGYLAVVFLVAKVTGALVVVESVLAYFLAAVVGRWLPRTGAWSTLFGRERFLALIVAAVFVRLVMEASALPWLAERYGFAHSRELYSVGLVLVPLLANSYWNATVVAAFPRVFLVTLLTYLAVDGLLLDYTNFTLSRFQVANENVSLSFLEAPHAYIILIVGAILAARDNIRYGWDYNGILVPALLAVSCYQPTKLVTTVVEALVILVVSVWLVRLPPLSKVLMVGSRRMLLCFTVGFLVKWASGAFVFLYWPAVQMVDYFGFGYLLPSLLAVKMWNTSRVGATLMPTLQVAVVAFVAGNALGAGMRFVDGASAATEGAGRVESVATKASLRLMLADSAPDPKPDRLQLQTEAQHQKALRFLRARRGGATDEALAPALPLAVQKHPKGWLTLAPVAQDPDADLIAPRVAWREGDTFSGWLVVVEAARVGDPIFVAGLVLAENLNAQLVSVRSRLSRVRDYDDALAAELSRVYDIQRVLVVREASGRASRLSVVGTVPAGLDVSGLSQELASRVQVSWRALSEAEGVYSNAAFLELPRDVIETRAARDFGSEAPVDWDGDLFNALATNLEPLTEVRPGEFQPPSIERLRIFGQAVLPALFSLRQAGKTPEVWHTALAAQLHYRFARLQQGAAWALYEPAAAGRRGNATFAVGVTAKPRAAPLLIEVPAPRWERGVMDVALALGRASEADAFLVSGALPQVDLDGAADVRRVSGARSYYQHAHEVWVQAGGRVVAVHGISPTQEPGSDVLLTLDKETDNPLAGAAWTRSVARTLLDGGLSVGAVDGSYETQSFDGARNPQFAYAQRFGRQQMMLVWLSAQSRSEFLQIRPEESTEQRLVRANLRPPLPDTLARAVQVSRCLEPRGSKRERDCPALPALDACAREELVDQLVMYSRSRNPYLLQAALEAGPCYREVTRDARSGHPWMLVADKGLLELVPLRTGPLRRSTHLLTSARDVARALALGLATLRVGPIP